MTTPAPKPKPKRKPAPAPPTKPTSFTGQVPSPPFRQSAREWGQRQRDRAQRAKAALGRTRQRAKRISRGQAKHAPTQRQANPATRPAGTRRRRIARPRKRSTLFTVLSVGVAALALTAVVLEIVSLAVASEMAFTAEGLGGIVVWWVGEPSNRGPVRQRQRPGGGKQPATGGGCSPACQHGKPEKSAECKCSCGGTKHGIKRAGGGTAPNTSKPVPRKRKPPAKPAQSPPTASKPPARGRPRTKPAASSAPAAKPASHNLHNTGA